MKNETEFHYSNNTEKVIQFLENLKDELQKKTKKNKFKFF